jgi:hypothetical protein
MMLLELQQRGLLDLIKSRSALPDNPYLRRVADSRELEMVRKIAVWWRKSQIEAQCRYTARLLKRLGYFDTLVAAYFNNHATSSFIEELGRDFLSSLRMQHDPLIVAVSQSEYAFLNVRAGSAEAFQIVWDRHPDLVFLALERGSELPASEPGSLYRIRIARDLPHMVTCTREFTL